MKKHTATLVLLLAVFGLSGCPIATITESFEYDVIEELNAGVPFDLTGEDGWYKLLDFSTDATFNDNKDKIENIDRATFSGAMHTLNDADAVVDIFFREVAEEGEEELPWTIILEDIEVPGASDAASLFKITYDESEPYIQNFTQFQKLAKGGIMELKLEAQSGNDEVLVSKLIIYIALSGG